MMTPRENYLAFLKNEPCEWIPCSVDQRRFLPVEICENIARAFVFQQEPYTGPMGGKDIFGLNWVYEPTAGGSIETDYPTDDVEEWEKFLKFPNLDDIDWEGAAKRNADYLNTDKLICTTIFTGYFERLISVVGFESAAMALIDEDQQEFVHAMFAKLTDLYIDMIQRMHKYWGVELVEFHDDWGNQRAAMFSPATHEEMILPYLTRLVAAAHECGVFMEMHSCGQISALIPNLISSGIDTWRGQAAVIDKPALVAQYGDKFKFGVELRPNGPISDEEVVALTKKTIAGCKGKPVCLIIGRTLPPAQAKLAYETVKSL